MYIYKLISHKYTILKRENSFVAYNIFVLLSRHEKMLDDLKVQAAYEENQMEQLKAAVSRCPRNIHVGHQELAAWVEGLGL